MKKKVIKGLTCVVTLLVLSMFLTACPDPESTTGNGPNGPDGPNGPGNEVVLGSVFLGGSFNGLGAGGGAFKVNHVVESENGGRSARSVVAVERTDALVPLLGSITDDGKFFELSGFMDPDTRQFFIGGGKDDLVYSITGSMDENDQLEISFIDIRQKDSLGEWKAEELPFARNDNITAPTRPAPTAAGIPSSFWGKWTDLPLCGTCGTPLPCPEGHSGCHACDYGNYCPQHTICNNGCGPGGNPRCPLHCSECQNGNYCSQHPCDECVLTNGNPPCPLHCHMCRNGNYCNDHPCPDPDCTPEKPCQAHCNMCKFAPDFCPDHGSGGGTGGGDRPGTGDKYSVKTSSLLLNASKSVNARSVASRSVASRSVGSIMAASEEDQESIIISQFGISKSRPWMDYLYEKAESSYNDWLDEWEPGFGLWRMSSWQGLKDGKGFHRASERGGRMNSIEATEFDEMSPMEYVYKMFGFSDEASYKAAMRHRFNAEAETLIKKDDINFLEYWEEDNIHFILGYKKEVEERGRWFPIEGFNDFAGVGDALYLADEDKRIAAVEEWAEVLFAWLEEKGLSYDEFLQYVTYLEWVDAGSIGEQPYYEGPKDIEDPRPTICAFNGYTVGVDGSLMGLSYQTFKTHYMTPIDQWPTLIYDGKTFKTYDGDVYCNDLYIGNAMNIHVVFASDPNFRSIYFADNVYVKIGLFNLPNGNATYVQKDGFGWEVIDTVQTPEGSYMDIHELQNFPIGRVKQLEFLPQEAEWGRKMRRW